MTQKADGLAEIFRMQAALQHRLGYDFNAMDNAKLTEYIRLNTLALTDELHEALNETHWKPWASSPPGFRDRDKFVGELIDAIHFLVNLCLAARMTPDELIDAFAGKNKVNHKRQDEGYSGNEKCDGPDCGRALDEPDVVSSIRLGTGERFCSVACLAAWSEVNE